MNPTFAGVAGVAGAAGAVVEAVFLGADVLVVFFFGAGVLEVYLGADLVVEGFEGVAGIIKAAFDSPSSTCLTS